MMSCDGSNGGLEGVAVANGWWGSSEEGEGLSQGLCDHGFVMLMDGYGYIYIFRKVFSYLFCQIAMGMDDNDWRIYYIYVL